MNYRLDNKTAAITGADVVLIDRDASQLDRVCAELGQRASPLVVDLLDTGAGSALDARIADTRPRGVVVCDLMIPPNMANL